MRGTAADDSASSPVGWAATVADNINALAQGRYDLTHYESWGVASDWRHRRLADRPDNQ